jgi:DnaJ domain
MDLQLALKWFELQKIGDLDLLSLKKKYRKLTLKYHPDKGGKTSDFVQLQAAYSFLQDCIKYPNTHQSNSQHGDSTDIEFYKQQVEELQKSNLHYQDIFNSQIANVNQFYQNLDRLNSQSNEYNSNLSKLLDDELAKLDKKYKSGWWKGMVGMKSMSKNDLVYYQNQLINEHNELLSKSQKNNQQDNYQAYRTVLDQIVQGMNKF